MKATDVDLAELALLRGWISKDCHHRSLLEADRYQALGLDKSVEEVLVEEGSLTAEQVRTLRNDLGFTLKRPRIGDYEIVRRVGLGGMGTVFEALHVRLKQRIALKVLFPRLARHPGQAERFLREARTLAKLNHPHLVHAVDAGQDGEYYYLAMEFIEGENLLQILQREGPLKPLRALEIVQAVCEALGVLEEKGLVHRDVKPANILIGPEGSVKLADLGLLKAVDEPRGLSEPFVCGTPHYISPEQIARRDDLDIRSDFYSLAATWYHLLVGRPPFVGRSTREILEAHLKIPPPPPSRLKQSIEAPLEDALLRWLSKKKEDRPPSALAALAELGRLKSLLETPRVLRIFPVRPFIHWLQSHSAARLLVVAVSLTLLGTLLALFVSGKDRSLVQAPRPSPISEPAQLPAVKPDLAPAPLLPPAPPTSLLPAEIPAPSLPSEPASEASSFPLPRNDGAPEPVVRADAPSRESFRTVLDCLSWQKSRLEELFLPYRGQLAAAASRYGPLARLGRSFHATFVALEPGKSPPAAILLFYDFKEQDELEDFRFRPGAWKVRDGALHGAVETSGGSLDSIALFTLPLELEGEIGREAPTILGLGSLRVAPGQVRDGRVWQGLGMEESPVLAAPAMPSGKFLVRFFWDRVELAFGERGPVRSMETRVPEMGRLSLRVASGGSVTRLVIRGTLEPTWAAERLRLLTAGGEGLEPQAPRGGN